MPPRRKIDEPSPLLFMDFDDVLAETRSARLSSLRSALADDGVTFSDETFDQACGGLSFAGAARMAVRLAEVGGGSADETTIELASLRAARTFGELIARGVPLARGAAEFVRKSAGIARLGIVTRAPRRDVDLVLSFAGLGDCFEVIMAAEDYSGPEPASEPFELAVVRMAHDHVIVVGGGIALVASLNAVAAARAARLHPIVVGPVSPTVAFAGEGYLQSLEGISARDVIQLVKSAGKR